MDRSLVICKTEPSGLYRFLARGRAAITDGGAPRAFAFNHQRSFMMNSLMRAGGEPITMTSLELVEYVNSQRGEGEAELRHDDFMRKAPKVLGEGVRKFSDTYLHPQNGQSYPCYRFPKREACLMAMSYSYDLQAKVFDRMTALEQRQHDPRIPQSLPEALQLAADLAKDVATKSAQLAIAAPKAAALDLIAAGDDDLTITQAAKVLGIKIAVLTNWMSANKWAYRQNGSWVAYQQHIENGRLRYKEAHYTDQNTGQSCIRPYCHITPKGLAKLAELFCVKAAA